MSLPIYNTADMSLTLPALLKQSFYKTPLRCHVS